MELSCINHILPLADYVTNLSCLVFLFLSFFPNNPLSIVFLNSLVWTISYKNKAGELKRLIPYFLSWAIEAYNQHSFSPCSTMDSVEIKSELHLSLNFLPISYIKKFMIPAAAPLSQYRQLPG